MRASGVLLVVVILVLFLGYSGCSAYNSLVSIDESVNQAWSDLESQYQRRADLIPNLVNTVRGATEFERETLEAVVQARANATSIQVSADDPQAINSFMAAQQQLGGALGRLLAVAENYPDLRATESFRDLQVQLEGTENRINQARRDYNAAVTSYNRQVRRFPTSIFAGVFGFERKQAFEAQEGAQHAPVVNF